jgi:hypothetical protein
LLYHGKIAVALLVVLVSLLPAGVFATPIAQQGDFKVSVAGTAAGSVPHEIDLKLTQLPGGQLSEVSGFAVSPEDVVQVKQGENLIVSTSPDLKTHQVTARNVQGISIDLVPLPNNVWALQGVIPGVYTLDVIVDVSSSSILGTFETFLVVLAPNQQPLPPTTVINQITIQPPPSNGCPGNLTLIDGECRQPSPPPPSPPPPCDPNEQVSGQKCICPEGTTGTPPDCEPINCDVEDPPPECEEPPTECPDGSIVPPGEDCPEPPDDGTPPDDGEDGSNGNGDDSEGSEDIPTVPFG